MNTYSRKSEHYFYLILLALPLISCHMSVSVYSQPSVIPIGSILSLNKKLRIPPGKTGVYIQAGQVMERTALNEYLPNCRFEVNSLNNSEFTIVNEDEFEVYKLMYESELVSSDTVMYAALNKVAYGVSAMADIRTTEFYLRSEKQPDVSRLRCGHWEDPTDAFHLTYDQVIQALGEIITVKLAPQ